MPHIRFSFNIRDYLKVEIDTRPRPCFCKTEEDGSATQDHCQNKDVATTSNIGWQSSAAYPESTDQAGTQQAQIQDMSLDGKGDEVLPPPSPTTTTNAYPKHNEQAERKRAHRQKKAEAYAAQLMRTCIGSSPQEQGNQVLCQDGFGSTASEPMGCFGRIPIEVRAQIYEELLVTGKWIFDSHKLVSTSEAIMESQCPRVGLRCGILRTHRQIYIEALPTLYGKNKFFFHNPEHLKTFAHGNLPTEMFVSRFGSQKTKFGRLSLIRELHLRIGETAHYSSLHTDRSSIWSRWDHLFARGISSCEPVIFPSLNRLVLDFSDWRLSALDTDEIRVEIIRMIVEKFRRSGGLSSLTIIGMSQEQNLFDLKQGLLKAGGEFCTSLP